ncbi:hypothetical protein [uncultured Croceitalea sp.]|uniref:hypothetical protein n=1 Tax=uncultured Croceitalea sp. TaxID=1798908 RepID=UPI00374EDA36
MQNHVILNKEMGKVLLFTILLSFCSFAQGQQNDKISTIEFVQIVNSNKEEAIFYFQNNWGILRKMAVERNYIHSYELLETPVSEKGPFQLMLMTTYLNEKQYKLREEHFEALINEKGSLKLLNDKKPSEFRKSLFSKTSIHH